MAHPLLVPLVCGLLHPPPWATAPPAFPLPGPPIEERAPFADDGTGLIDHETVTGVVGTATSTHFALKWGPLWTPTDAQAAQVLAIAEGVYRSQIEELGFTRPWGMTIARFNMYLANTGLSAGDEPLTMPEEMLGAASLDLEGWPMFAFAPHAWDADAAAVVDGRGAPGDVLTIVIAHEFQHTSQFAAAAWPFDLAHLWWFEGLAVWAHDHAVPNSWFTWGNIVQLYLEPERAIEQLIDDSDPLEEQRGYAHAYGTAALFKTLEHHHGADLVVQWAQRPPSATTPMPRLDVLLDDRNSDVDDAALQMWAALQTGRPFGFDALQSALTHIEDLPEPLPADHNPTGTLVVDGDEATPPAALRPQRFGANVWQIPSPIDDLIVTIDGDDHGSAGTQTRWGLTAVRCGDGVCEEVGRSTGGAATTLSIAAAGAERVDVIVVPLADSYVDDETFDYRLRADIDDTAVGCTCAGGLSAGLFPVLWITVVAVRRRRKS